MLHITLKPPVDKPPVQPTLCVYNDSTGVLYNSTGVIRLNTNVLHYMPARPSPRGRRMSRPKYSLTFHSRVGPQPTRDPGTAPGSLSQAHGFSRPQSHQTCHRERWGLQRERNQSIYAQNWHFHSPQSHSTYRLNYNFMDDLFRRAAVFPKHTTNRSEPAAGVFITAELRLSVPKAVESSRSWRNSTMIPCYLTTVTRWYLNTMIPQYLDTMIPWYLNTIQLDNWIPWYLDTSIWWYLNTLIFWYFNTSIVWYSDSSNTLILQYKDTSIPWYLNTMISWYLDKSNITCLLSYCSLSLSFILLISAASATSCSAHFSPFHRCCGKRVEWNRRITRFHGPLGATGTHATALEPIEPRSICHPFNATLLFSLQEKAAEAMAMDSAEKHWPWKSSVRHCSDCPALDPR